MYKPIRIILSMYAVYNTEHWILLPMNMHVHVHVHVVIDMESQVEK